MMTPEKIEEQAHEFRRGFEKARAEVAKMIVGHPVVVEGVLIGLFAGGHCLLEGVPGLGKTMLVRSLALALDLDFKRIQFTPDLMPADIVGTNLVVESESGGREFRFQKGPVFSSIVLADEINRATPKTQSALLEAMQERTVTVGGVAYPLSETFLVLATQNPIEMEGTYPLPEAQLDRFLFKLVVKPSGREDLNEILKRTTESSQPEPLKVLDSSAVTKMKAFARGVVLAPHVRDLAVRLTLATSPGSKDAPPGVNKYVRFGSSPRGAQSIALAAKVRALVEGRINVSFADVRNVAPAALRHRVILNFEAEAEGVTADSIVESVLAIVKDLEA